MSFLDILEKGLGKMEEKNEELLEYQDKVVNMRDRDIETQIKIVSDPFKQTVLKKEYKSRLGEKENYELKEMYMQGKRRGRTDIAFKMIIVELKERGY